MALKHLAFHEPQGAWIEQGKPLASEGAPFRIVLMAGPHLQNLRGMLSADPEFGVRPSSEHGFAGDGVYVLRDGELVARVDTTQEQELKDSADQMRHLLLAQVVFKGDPDDLLIANGKMVAKSKSWITDPKISHVFALQGDRLVSINKNLVASGDSAVGFLEHVSSAVFMHPVEILAATR